MHVIALVGVDTLITRTGTKLVGSAGSLFDVSEDNRHAIEGWPTQFLILAPAEAADLIHERDLVAAEYEAQGAAERQRQVLHSQQAQVEAERRDRLVALVRAAVRPNERGDNR